MPESNTLFILARWGLKVVDGMFESHVWILSDIEASMKYVSLHKSKADRATKGGEIIEVRHATGEEIEAHQTLLLEKDIGPMQIVKDRKIVVFRLESKWNAIWPQEAKTNPMAYKGLGYVRTVESNG